MFKISTEKKNEKCRNVNILYAKNVNWLYSTKKIKKII